MECSNTKDNYWKTNDLPGRYLLDRLRVADRFRTSLPQIFTVDKALLTEKIGRLDLQRVRQILAGLALITAPAVIDEYP
jgi:hypothetical protein